MATRVERFEDLIAWQKARKLTKGIYQLTRTGEFSKDFELRDQLRGASISIMSNIAEGFERNRSGEFHQFLSIAKASCAELRSQLYIALDTKYLDKPQFDELMTQAEEVGRVVGGLRAAVERKKNTKAPK